MIRQAISPLLAIRILLKGGTNCEAEEENQAAWRCAEATLAELAASCATPPNLWRTIRNI
jgi:hypothetical protein